MGNVVFPVPLCCGWAELDCRYPGNVVESFGFWTGKDNEHVRMQNGDMRLEDTHIEPHRNDRCPNRRRSRMIPVI